MLFGRFTEGMSKPISSTHEKDAKTITKEIGRSGSLFLQLVWGALPCALQVQRQRYFGPTHVNCRYKSVLPVARMSTTRADSKESVQKILQDSYRLSPDRNSMETTDTVKTAAAKQLKSATALA